MAQYFYINSNSVNPTLRMELVDPLIVNFKPSEEDMKNAVNFGKKFIEKAIDKYSIKKSNRKVK